MEEEKLSCKMRGLAYPAAQGRKHGPTFKCWGCLNIEQMIRRNLGSTCELQQWSPEALGAFFQSCHAQDKTQGVNWKTARAAYVRKLTESQMATFAAQVEVEELPRSVLKTRGWEDAVIDQFETYHSDSYGCTVHKVPVRRLQWSEENLTMWRRCEPRTWKLRPLSEVRGCRPYDIAREGNNSLWFL